MMKITTICPNQSTTGGFPCQKCLFRDILTEGFDLCKMTRTVNSIGATLSSIPNHNEKEVTNRTNDIK